MKLTFTAKDDSGTALVTFWDELATQLMGKTVLQLKQELPEVHNIQKLFSLIYNFDCVCILN